MPEEIEVPTEHLHETLHEEAHKAHGAGGGHADSGPSWVGRVALSSALIAVLAATAALFAGHHANEAMLEQMKATDKWAYYQAKGIKSAVLTSKIELLEQMGKTPRSKEKDLAKIEEYGADQKKIDEEGHELEKSSEEHMHRHSVLARSVTTFQVAIALSAISVLTKKQWLWYGSLVLGIGGAAFMAQALM